MRTTLTLDDDVALQLDEEMRRSGQSFKETVNRLLRSAVTTQRDAAPAPFVVRPRPLHRQPGVDLSNIGALLEQLEGPSHR